MMKSKYKATVFLAIIFAMLLSPMMSAATGPDETALYNAYRDSFNSVSYEGDISKNGFRIIETQKFDVEHQTFGLLTIIPAIHVEHQRMALFFALEDETIVFKTDDFMSNTWVKGEVKQTNREVICISCTDLDGDELLDIIVISSCQNDSGVYGDKPYNVGDALFQNGTGFYRDPRISDKINRFDMNKSAEYIYAFIRSGVSMEFLFVANDYDELLADGFKPIDYLQVSEHLEKFGVVDVIPGFYDMTGQYYLMVYIVDQSGNILWNFQPMHYYANFYNILAVSLKDIDGDGNKDLTLIARYVAYDEDGNAFLKTDYNIYYQRAGYFLEDTEFKRSHVHDENDEDGDIDGLTNKARQYWGWPQ